MEHEKGPLVGGFVNLQTHALENKVVITHETSSLSFEKSNDSVATYFQGDFIVGVQEHHRQRFYSVNMEKSSAKEFGTGDFINIVDVSQTMQDVHLHCLTQRRVLPFYAARDIYGASYYVGNWNFAYRVR